MVNPLNRWLLSSKSVVGAAVTIAAASFFSRLLGVFRDRILAGSFGAGDTLDIYYTAFRVPDLVYNLLIVGALSAGFIPTFIGARQRGEDQWRLANAFLSVVLVGLMVAAIMAMVFMPQLAPLIAPGFDAEKTAEVARLSRIMFLSPILLGVSAVIGGVLQSYRQFFVYSLAPIFYNVGIIVGALFFVPYFGTTGLAWGVVLGALLHLMVQWPMAHGLGWNLRFRWEPRHPGLRTIGEATLPRVVALGAAQLNVFVLTIIASYLSSGSVAVFNLAMNLNLMPVGLIGISYALAAFPTLSERAAAKDTEGFRTAFSESVRQVLFFILPAAVFIVLLRAQLVRAVLGSGAFDWADTILTFETLQWLAIGLFAQALTPLLVRSFYARHDSMTPLVVSVLGDMTTIFLAVQLMSEYGVQGLAMAFSAGVIVQTVGLWLSLHWYVGDLDERATLHSLWKFTIACGVAAVVLQGVKTGVGAFVGTETFSDVALQGGLAGISGLLTYGAVLAILRSSELETFLMAVRRRFSVISMEREGLEQGTM